jgi:hypothetical protein
VPGVRQESQQQGPQADVRKGHALMWFGRAVVTMAAPPAPSGRICAACGLRNPFSGDDLCAHHLALGAEWAAGNRKFCDFVHRGVLSPRLTAPPEDDWL